MTRTIYVVPVNPESTAAVHVFPLRKFQDPEIWFLFDESLEGSLDLLENLLETIETFQYKVLGTSQVSLFGYLPALNATLDKFDAKDSPFNDSQETIIIYINESTNAAPVVSGVIQGFAILRKKFPKIQIRPVFIRRDKGNIPKGNVLCFLPDPTSILREEDIEFIRILQDQQNKFDSQVELLNYILGGQNSIGMTAESAGQMKLSRLLRRLADLGFIKLTPTNKTNRIEIEPSLRGDKIE